jgi:tetraacyldisaccharide 4'-kinase
MGGTGKSPAIEWFIKTLQPHYKLATLSRGYKRTTKGYKEVISTSNVHEVGDEPLQFKLKFPEVKVVVDENRANGIQQIKRNFSTDVVLLDDAFQHRRVAAGLNVLLSVYDDLYVNDWILPAGNLRETTHGAKRADVIIITKCPENLSLSNRKSIEKKIKLTKKQQLYFSYIGYSTKVFSTNSALELIDFTAPFTLVTGIANPTSLLNKLSELGKNFTHMAYPDHHTFSESELENLQQKNLILTTEKDYVRLKDYISPEKLFYLPIEMKLFEEDKLTAEVMRFCASFNNSKR